VQIDQDRRAARGLRRRENVRVLGERGAVGDTRAVYELPAHPLALPRVKLRVGGRVRNHPLQGVLRVQLLLRRKVPVKHRASLYLPPNNRRQSGGLAAAGGARRAGSPNGGRPCSARTALRPRVIAGSDRHPSPASDRICSSILASASPSTPPRLAASYLMPSRTESLFSIPRPLAAEKPFGVLGEDRVHALVADAGLF